MSEDKFYAVKKYDDTGDYYWDFSNFRTWSFAGAVETGTGFLKLEACERPVFSNKVLADRVASNYGGHVVTLAEVPKKRVLTKEQAQIIENARKCTSLTGYISQHCADSLEELLLVSAYVNGYSVQKDKKYNVKVPHAEGWHFQKYSPESKRGLRNNWRPFPAKDVDSNMSKDLFLFTEAEIEHYGLQDCEKVEVTDDEQ